MPVTVEPLPTDFATPAVPVFHKGNKVRHKADPDGPELTVLTMVDGLYGCRWTQEKTDEQGEPVVDEQGEPVVDVYHDNFRGEQLLPVEA